MPRRKYIKPTNPDNLPIPDLVEEVPTQTIALVPPATPYTDEPPLPDLSASNRVLQKREEFENAAADELELVRENLHAILTSSESSAKDVIAASKLLLQVNGLLDKKQTVDADSISNLIALLVRKNSVTIKDVTDG